jgi:hypothetical protein
MMLDHEPGSWVTPGEQEEIYDYFRALGDPSAITAPLSTEAEVDTAFTLMTAFSQETFGIDCLDDTWRLGAQEMMAQEPSERLRHHYDMAALSFPAAEEGLVRERVAYNLNVSIPGLPRGRTVKCLGFFGTLRELEASLCNGKFPPPGQVTFGFAVVPHFYKARVEQRTTFTVAVGKECTVLPGSAKEDDDGTLVAKVMFTNAMRPGKAFAEGGKTQNTFMHLHAACLYFDDDANTWIFATSAGAYLKLRSNAGKKSVLRNTDYSTMKGAKRASSSSSFSASDDDDDSTAAEGAKRGRAKPRKK